MQLENFSELSKVASHPVFRDENAGLQAPRSLQITHVIHGTLLVLFFDLTHSSDYSTIYDLRRVFNRFKLNYIDG